jgi:hypothetical protein
VLYWELVRNKKGVNMNADDWQTLAIIGLLWLIFTGPVGIAIFALVVLIIVVWKGII